MAIITAPENDLTRFEIGKIESYYQSLFLQDVVYVMGAQLPYPDNRTLHLGTWQDIQKSLRCIHKSRRPSFLVCLFFTILVDQAMHDYYANKKCKDYMRFRNLTRYPKLRAARAPALSPFVILEYAEDTLKDSLVLDGVKLFVKEVADFCDEHMRDIEPKDFFLCLLADSDVKPGRGDGKRSWKAKVFPWLRNEIQSQLGLPLRPASCSSEDG